LIVPAPGPVDPGPPEPARRIRRDIDGILLLDKPIGLSSNQALQRVKWLFQARKAGHTGSLDPLATGMLPVCLGEATKVSAYLLDSDKVYRVRMALGRQTTTGDAEGPVIATGPETLSPVSGSHFADPAHVLRTETAGTPVV
jgi:tRNA pseudouridine55 synthase